MDLSRWLTKTDNCHYIPHHDIRKEIHPQHFYRSYMFVVVRAYQAWMIVCYLEIHSWMTSSISCCWCSNSHLKNNCIRWGGRIHNAPQSQLSKFPNLLLNTLWQLYYPQHSHMTASQWYEQHGNGIETDTYCQINSEVGYPQVYHS